MSEVNVTNNTGASGIESWEGVYMCNADDYFYYQAKEK